jgi:Tol biopolymer transport system component
MPSFCAAEPEWGSGNLIAFSNMPGYVIPPETPWPQETLPVGLWVTRPDGTGLKSLAGATPDGVAFYGMSPKWSPDGRWIWATDSRDRLWKVTPDGDSFVPLHLVVVGEFSISPDGRKLAIGANDDSLGVRGVRILDIETGTVKPVLPYAMDPSWSPDGSRLVCNGALWEVNSWIHGIIVVDTSGENVRLVCKVDDRYNGKAASFSPDGEEIAFHKQDDVNHIWVVNVDGTNPRRITKKGGGWPSWSPAGTKMVYTRVTEYISTGVREFGIPPGAEGIGDLYVINPDGSGEARLTYFYPR